MAQFPIFSGKIIVVESENQRLLASTSIKHLNQSILELLELYHKNNPLKSGIGKEELRSQLIPKVDHKLFLYVLNNLIKKGSIVHDKADIRLATHSVVLQVDEKKMQDDILTLYRRAGLNPPNLKDVFAEGHIKETLHFLEKGLNDDKFDKGSLDWGMAVLNLYFDKVGSTKTIDEARTKFKKIQKFEFDKKKVKKLKLHTKPKWIATNDEAKALIKELKTPKPKKVKEVKSEE